MKTPGTVCNPSITIRLTVDEAMEFFHLLSRMTGDSPRTRNQIGCCIRRTIANTHPGLFVACFGYKAADLHRMAEVYEPLPMDAPEDTKEIEHAVAHVTKLYANDAGPAPTQDPMLPKPVVVREVHHHHYHVSPPKRPRIY